MLSCPKLNLHPTRFRINELKGRRTGRRGITNGKARPMQHKKSDELIVAMMVEPMIYRTCAAGYRGRRYEDKTQLNGNPFYGRIFYAFIPSECR